MVHHQLIAVQDTLLGFLSEPLCNYALIVLTLVRMYPSKVGCTLALAIQGTNTNKLRVAS